LEYGHPDGVSLGEDCLSGTHGLFQSRLNCRPQIVIRVGLVQKNLGLLGVITHHRLRLVVSADQDHRDVRLDFLVDAGSKAQVTVRALWRGYGDQRYVTGS
jgi:hypothetical protein